MATVEVNGRVHTPRTFVNAFMKAWNSGDAEALSLMIHPETEIETPVAPLVGICRGRADALALLLEMRESVSLDVDSVHEDSATVGVVYGRTRRPRLGGGFADGSMQWRIELVDGMVWRSEIVYPSKG